MATTRKSDRASFDPICMPQAMPLFSMNEMKNQSVTRMLSCSSMLVFTQILMIWSMSRMATTMRVASHPLDISFFLFTCVSSPVLSTLRSAWHGALHAAFRPESACP